jgi:hypothetical protein
LSSVPGAGVEPAIALSEVAEFDRGLPARTLMAFCKSHHMSCFDTTPAVLRAAAESPTSQYKPRDTHLNIHGNQVVAQAEAEFLTKELCQAPPAARQEGGHRKRPH